MKQPSAPPPSFLILLLALPFVASACDRANDDGAARPDTGLEKAESNPLLPGFETTDEALQQRLEQARIEQGSGYRPRTRHLRRDGTPRFTNRLIEESNPYLLQHAHNPVSWYPWSEEAFARAKRENKPVFLSVGYSTCHWCHVMERESFEDEEIAAFLNRHFIAIKVDREERPDIDSVYMTAVTLMTGRGGWPMTVIMTPDKEPFFGGTYFPPRAGVRGARAGLIDILVQMVAIYRSSPSEVVARAQEISQQVERSASTHPGPGVPSDETIAVAVSQLATSFDRVNGGFTGAPKFPQPSRLLLLLRYARRTGDPGATAMVTTTLRQMAAGGIYDHVGGGFHRYSTDTRWLVPHFEKMLYDNAQLAVVYLEAWQLTGDPAFPRVVREILDYVAAEMTAEEGGFYSASDADSPTPNGPDQEGWFFTWTPEELQAALDPQGVSVVAAAYDVTEGGNFEGRNVLHRKRSNREVARDLGMPVERVADVLAQARPKLYAARAARPSPLIDDKVIAAWNGLTISAFARAGWALGDAGYVEKATRAASFLLSQMRDESKGLARAYRRGKKSGSGFLDDYAFVVAACLDLYEATAVSDWLRAALELQGEQDARFVDDGDGGYFLTPDGAEALLFREKPAHDLALPSGSSVAANNLLRLNDMTGDEEWRRAAERLFASLALQVTRTPTAFASLLVALDRYYDVPLQIAIIAPERQAEGLDLVARLRGAFVPNKVALLLTEPEAARQTSEVPWLEAKRALVGRPTAYVCERGRCDLPTSDPGVFASLIRKIRPYPSFGSSPPSPLPFEAPK